MPLSQHGGEGTGSYSGKKSDQSLKQHGGEGKVLSKKTDMKLSQGTPKHRGPGMNLGVVAYKK